MDLKELELIMKCSTCLSTGCEMKVVHNIYICVWPCMNVGICCIVWVIMSVCSYMYVLVYAYLYLCIYHPSKFLRSHSESFSKRLFRIYSGNC